MQFGDRTTPLASTSPPKFDVIVPVHGHHALASRALASVIDGNARAVESVVVVDDGSRAPFELGAAVRLNSTTPIRVLRTSRRRGFLAAVEFALPLCESPFVLVLNSDATVPPGALEAVSRETTPWDVLGFVSQQAGEFSLPFTEPTLRDRALLRNRPAPSHDLKCVDSVLRNWGVEHPERIVVPSRRFHGFCFGFRQPFINQIGGLRGRLPASGRGFESDLSMRVHRAGGIVAVYLGHLLQHEGSASTAQGRRVFDTLVATAHLSRHYRRSELRRLRAVPPEILALRERCRTASC
jgi:glycosyltransferase involved in cell wall biosynthesis